MTAFIALAAAPFVVLTLFFSVEILAGLRPLRRSGVCFGTRSATIIVPAHNEEEILAANLQQLIIAAGRLARILVVADNCTDATASIAEQMGVDVLKRNDDAKRGKGFALQFARDHLRGSPPEVVVVIDADCHIDAKSLAALIGECARVRRPVQAIYLFAEGVGGSAAVQLSSFAFFVKNVVRQRGLQRLAGRVQLLGTGMALPWPLFDTVTFAAHSVVEDLELGLELAAEGHPPVFVEGATVWSAAANKSNTLEQRRRWEGGYLAAAKIWVPRMLLSSFRVFDGQMLLAALSLLIPPLALLFLLDLLLLLLAVVLAFGGAYWWPVALLASVIGLACASVISAWLAGGHRFVSARTIISAPAYILWKISIYTGIVRRGAVKNWVRTSRNIH